MAGLDETEMGNELSQPKFEFKGLAMRESSSFLLALVSSHFSFLRFLSYPIMGNRTKDSWKLSFG